MDDWKQVSIQGQSATSFDFPMVDPTPAAEPVPYFIPYYIGHHETKRALPVTEAVLAQSAHAGYDMITSPITNDHFHSRVLTLLSNHLNTNSNTEVSNLPAPIIPPFDAVDTPLTPGDVASQLVCHTASWIDISSPDPIVASVSRQVLTMEVAYAAFCGIQNLIIPGPRQYNSSAAASDGITRFARTVQEAMTVAGFINMAISIPMYSEGQEPHLRPLVGDLEPFGRPEFRAEETDLQHELFGTWDAWNAIRNMCKYNPRLSIALEIPRQLPTQSLLDRWFCEPLKILSFAPNSFLRNKAGHPVLGKTHQALLTRYMRLKNAPWLLLCDVGPLPTFPYSSTPPSTASFGSPPMSASSSQHTTSELPHRGKGRESLQPSLKDQTAHLIYLRHLQTHQPPQSELERFGSGYQDYLQSPLQPLTDNLESVTYEVFEKDPVKYERYERAITLALADWKELNKPTSGPEGRVVVTVAGPGRGPLVTRALRASQTTCVPIEIYAVEKNPNAYVLLQRHNETDPLWSGRVHVIKSDMRAWKGPRRYTDPNGIYYPSDETVYGKVDILISELLGSFGDNELSPECLDGVQHVLAPSGISIPANYTSHISPIAAPRLHSDILARSSDPEASNTAYVCMLHAIDFLSKYEVGRMAGQGVVKETWEFKHPLPRAVIEQSERRRMGGVSGGGGGAMAGSDGANEHNCRYSRTTFSVRDRAVCNGVAGYFESILYDGRRSVDDENGGQEITGELVEMSIRPDTIEEKSKDMISWFPIFFPLKQPLYIPDDAEVDISMWRQTDDRKVWYEWQAEVFAVVGDGRRLRVGSSEVSSSRNKGCLM